MQSTSALKGKLLFVFLAGVFASTGASPHHDDLIRPQIKIMQLHEHHIFRLKGLIFGLLGFTGVIILAYLLYQYVIQLLRAKRNQTGAAFSERGSLLPISEFDQPAMYVQPLFGPLVSLRNYVGRRWGTNAPTPMPGSTHLYRPKYAGDPWEHL